MSADDASRLAAALRAAPARPGARVLAIDGPSGAGKTTLAGRVAAELGAPVFHLEAIHPGWDGLEATIPRLVEWVLAPAARGEPPRYRRWDWDRGEDAEWHELPAGPLLVVEGVGSGALACAPYLSVLAWVDAPADVRYERAMARDGETYRPHWDRWAAQEDAHFAAQRTAERADLHVGGSRWIGSSAMTAYPIVRVDAADDAQMLPWMQLVRLVFKDHGTPDPGWLASRRGLYAEQRLTAATDGGLMVGTYRSWDLDLTVPGGALVASAISSVTVRPSHRRRGVLSSMIGADLAETAERGVPVAVLIASEAPIYGRYGFGACTEAVNWHVASRRARFTPEADALADGVTIEDLVADADIREAGPRVYARSRRPGEIDRAPLWWDVSLGLAPPARGEPSPAVNVLARDRDGDVQGILRYTAEDRHVDREARTVITIEILHAATPEAYAGLWRYLTGIDLVHEIVLTDDAVDQPLPQLFTDPRAARARGRCDFLWSRVLDPAAVLAGRSYDGGGSVVLEVTDPRGWAAGRFALEVSAEGEAQAGRTTAPADVELPVSTLGAIWLGGADLATLAGAGRATELRKDGLRRAGGLFRSATAPCCSTWF